MKRLLALVSFVPIFVFACCDDTPSGRSRIVDFDRDAGLPKASIRQDFTFPVERT